MSGTTYYIDFKMVLAGALYNILEKDLQARFLSNSEFNRYCQALTDVIRRSGSRCILKIDRYNADAVLPSLADIIEKTERGFQLAATADKDALIDRFFGSVPVPIIKYMQVAEENLV